MSTQSQRIWPTFASKKEWSISIGPPNGSPPSPVPMASPCLPSSALPPAPWGGQAAWIMPRTGGKPAPAEEPATESAFVTSSASVTSQGRTTTLTRQQNNIQHNSSGIRNSSSINSGIRSVNKHIIVLTVAIATAVALNFVVAVCSNSSSGIGSNNSSGIRVSGINYRSNECSSVSFVFCALVCSRGHHQSHQPPLDLTKAV